MGVVECVGDLIVLHAVTTVGYLWACSSWHCDLHCVGPSRT